MTYDRAIVLAKLKKIAPGLGSRAWVQTDVCFHFAEGRAWSSSGELSYSVPFTADFTGAVPGQPLIVLLDSSRAKTVELTMEGAELLVKVGRTKSRLPVCDIHRIPAPHGTPVGNAAQFWGAFMLVAKCASNDPSSTCRMGVTIVFEDETIRMFSTNNVTLSEAVVLAEIPGPLLNRVIQVSLKFCAAIGGKYWQELFVSDQEVFCYSGDELTLGCRILPDADSDMYDSILTSFGVPENELDISPAFSRAVHRASVFAKGGVDKRSSVKVRSALPKGVHTRVVVTPPGHITLHTISSTGEVTDIVPLEGEHASVDVDVFPTTLALALPDMDRISVEPGFLRLSSETGQRFVATVDRV